MKADARAVYGVLYGPLVFQHGVLSFSQVYLAIHMPSEEANKHHEVKQLDMTLDHQPVALKPHKALIDGNLQHSLFLSARC